MEGQAPRSCIPCNERASLWGESIFAYQSEFYHVVWRVDHSLDKVADAHCSTHETRPGQPQWVVFHWWEESVLHR